MPEPSPPATSFTAYCLRLALVLIMLTGASLSWASQSTTMNGSTGWSSFGGPPGGGQFSAAATIDPGNVDRLERAWAMHTGDVVDLPAFDGGTSFQATPILWNRTLYICTPLNRVIALDAVSGDVKWAFDAHQFLPAETPRIAGNCRGVAIAADAGAENSALACAARIYRGDVFGNFFAIDAKTGSLCSDCLLYTSPSPRDS